MLQREIVTGKGKTPSVKNRQQLQHSSQKQQTAIVSTSTWSKFIKPHATLKYKLKGWSTAPLAHLCKDARTDSGSSGLRTTCPSSEFTPMQSWRGKGQSIITSWSIQEAITGLAHSYTIPAKGTWRSIHFWLDFWLGLDFWFDFWFDSWLGPDFWFDFWLLIWLLTLAWLLIWLLTWAWLLIWHLTFLLLTFCCFWGETDLEDFCP